jgi:hypothetical protein
VTHWTPRGDTDARKGDAALSRISPQSLLRIALAFVLLAVLTHTRADPDLWGHVFSGRDVIEAGRVPTTDPYSFMADRPWINHGWLADTFMYLVHTIAGAAGLAVLKVSVLLGMLGAVWFALTRQQILGRDRDLLLMLAVIGVFAQANHVRPQLFSLLLFSWLLVLLTTAPRSQWLVAIPALFAAWVNLHGGWIVGGATLALWTAFAVVGPGTPRWKVTLVIVGVLSLAATLVNPYGWRLWAFIWNTVGFGRAEISDWQPVFRLGLSYGLLWTGAAVAAAVAAYRNWTSGERNLSHIAIVSLLAIASFRVSRLLAFFTIAVVIQLGADLVSAVRAWRTRVPATGAQPRRGVVMVVIVISAALIGGGAFVSANNLGCLRMESASHPEPEVVALMKDRQMRGRLAVWFDWGEYAIWYLAPALSVSIDGRRETVYSEDVMNSHLNFYYVPTTREKFLDATRPDYIWLPPDLPVVATLEADGWVRLYSGPRSVLLGRSGTPAARSNVVPADRCFPGP